MAAVRWAAAVVEPRVAAVQEYWLQLAPAVEACRWAELAPAAARLVAVKLGCWLG